jgi:hypothetical protein
MAVIAEAKRQHYRDHAFPFQRPAPDGESIHAAFLPKLIEWDGFIVLVHESQPSRVDGFVVARVGSAPPPFGEGALFHVDDFALASPDKWPTAGRDLLCDVAACAATTGAETGIVVSGPSSVDRAKTDFLIGSGFVAEAEWWVKAIEPSEDEIVPNDQMFEAIVGPAPPVYDPGGLTCLALRIEAPEALEQFEAFASASDSVVAIVPVLTKQTDIREALKTRHYVLASEWYAAPVTAIV